jgi:hypothetical protein
VYIWLIDHLPAERDTQVIEDTQYNLDWYKQHQELYNDGETDASDEN